MYGGKSVKTESFQLSYPLTILNKTLKIPIERHIIKDKFKIEKLQIVLWEFGTEVELAACPPLTDYDLLDKLNTRITTNLELKDTVTEKRNLATINVEMMLESSEYLEDNRSGFLMLNHFSITDPDFIREESAEFELEVSMNGISFRTDAQERDKFWKSFICTILHSYSSQ